MSKFTRLSSHHVRSKDGFEVEIKEPDGLLYREREGNFVDFYRVPLVSYSSGERYDLIHIDHHLGWNSHPKLLTDADRRRIKRRVHSALKFMRQRHEFR